MSGYVLQMHNITKSYRDGKNERRILDQVNLSVMAGEFAAIVGPSGCGKSTLLNIAGMMLAPDEGEISLGGQQVSALPRKKWTAVRRDRIGFIFQNHQLLPYLRAGEQLSVLKKTDRSKVEELFDELDIRPLLNQYPATLSGGERQRVAIARAFASDADLILADEPTASLDAERGRHVVERIRMEVHRRSKAAVMVTHDERVLDLADRIYRMEDGRLTAVSA